MRVYIIGNDGLILCREPPAAVNEGEIVVASKEELHAAQLSGKRLLALWNALPGVEKRKKVGDRGALIDQLWSAIEALTDPDQQSDTKRASKQEAVIAMLQRLEGATIDEVASAMGWQWHTVRGLFSGTLKKKLGLNLASAQEERGRSTALPLRRRHEPRGPGCNGVPGGALTAPRAQSRGASSAVAHSLQNEASPHLSRGAAGASCRIPDAGSRSWRAALRAAAPVPPNCTAVQKTGAATTPRRPELKPGTRLVREWQGQTYEVLVLDEGFSWQGTQHRSLSAFARKITGTAWSGPLFFGVKPNRPASRRSSQMPGPAGAPVESRNAAE
jgi:hypothetical protein